MGRPCKSVDEKRVIELASKGMTIKEIAALEDVSYWTLHRRFAKACEKGAELCNGMLRAKQFERAMAGSDTMLIWLGKQRLGQKDKTEVVNQGVRFELGDSPRPSEVDNTSLTVQ